MSATIEAEAGEHISRFAKRLIALANARGAAVRGEFNETLVVANPHDDPTALVVAYNKAREPKARPGLWS